MRELELTIHEHLLAGLKPSTVYSNVAALDECRGFRCGRLWLEGYEAFDSPLNPLFPLPHSWPFPQVLQQDSCRILTVRDDNKMEDRVYSMDESGDKVVQIAVLPWKYYGKGSLFDLADFGKYAILTNGNVLIHYNLQHNLWDMSVDSSKVPLMAALCNFRGQAIGGNVKSPWYDCDSTYIIWSKIGELDFTVDSKNTAGYRRDPFGGEVYNVMSLGDRIIVYTSRGITSMMPVIEPVPSFGFIELYDIGILNKGAVAGNFFKHIFLTSDYTLHELTKGGIRNLGYQDYMHRLSPGPVIITYNQSLREFYISNGSTTFLLTEKGLTEITQHPSATWFSNGTQWMLSTIDDRECLIVTTPFDFGYRGSKTVFTTEVGLQNYESASVSYDWKIDNSEFKSTPWQPVNNQGVSTQIIAGTDFRARLSIRGVTKDTVLSYIKVRYKMTDLRSIRGIYAPPPRGQVDVGSTTA